MDARRVAFFLFGAVLLYTAGYTAAHLGTPLGQSPQLDGRENTALAVQIASGELPREPFYRAMLYPALLALAAMAGLPHGLLPEWAALLGIAAHLTAAWLVFRIAHLLWSNRRAALLAGALYGFYPVAIYFAAQPLDVTVGIALFLAGMERLLACAPRRGTRRYGCAWTAGVFLGLAVLARPHFLAVVPVGLLLFGALRGGFRHSLWATIGVVMLLAAQAAVNGLWSGSWRMLPWQGAYNLYAANRSESDGRYFQQQLYFHEIPPGTNPTRLESEARYRDATGAEPPVSIAEMNAHWRRQTISGIRDAPLRWIGHKLRKIYYLGHNWESYNNQTYAFHKAQSPWLRFNPLGWGLLFAAAAAGGVVAYRRADRTRFLLLAGSAAAYAAGVLLFFVSARFRLPLVPVLCILAAGIALLPECRLRARRGWWTAACAAVVLAWSFSPFWGAYDRRTFLQDKLLLANAAAETGADADAYRWAQTARKTAPERPDARRIALVSYFNLRLDGVDPEEIGDWNAQRDLIDGLHDPDPVLALAAGAVSWNLGRPDQAASSWRDAWRRFGPAAADALGALLWTGIAGEAEADAAPEILRATGSAILEAGLERHRQAPGPSSDQPPMHERMQRVFPVSAQAED